MIKGFPWPSYDHRICLVNISLHDKITYLHQCLSSALSICLQVVKTGYTSLEQIILSISESNLIYLLREYMNELLKEL